MPQYLTHGVRLISRVFTSWDKRNAKRVHERHASPQCLICMSDGRNGPRLVKSARMQNLIRALSPTRSIEEVASARGVDDDQVHLRRVHPRGPAAPHVRVQPVAHRGRTHWDDPARTPARALCVRMYRNQIEPRAEKAIHTHYTSMQAGRESNARLLSLLMRSLLQWDLRSRCIHLKFTRGPWLAQASDRLGALCSEIDLRMHLELQ